MSIVSRDAAQAFAEHWIEAWNSHDLEAILSHYVEEVVFFSPVAAQRVGQGTVVGKDALRKYWSAGLAAQPQLHFELQDLLLGHHALTLLYRNHRNQSVAETFEFNASGQVVRAYACYA